VCGQHHAPATFTPGKDPVPIVQEDGWAPEPVWIGAENLASPGFHPQTFQPVCHCGRNVDKRRRDSYQATWPHISEEVCPHIYLCDKLEWC
jgi:hypothetical protein